MNDAGQCRPIERVKDMAANKPNGMIVSHAAALASTLPCTAWRSVLRWRHRAISSQGVAR